VLPARYEECHLSAVSGGLDAVSEVGPDPFEVFRASAWRETRTVTGNRAKRLPQRRSKARRWVGRLAFALFAVTLLSAALVTFFGDPVLVGERLGLPMHWSTEHGFAK
jgi:hypothetical protein